MQLLKMAGAVAAVATTSGRKAFSMILSFLLFPKRFSVMYVYGFFAVFGSIGQWLSSSLPISILPLPFGLAPKQG
jgi:hypothetical protein